MMCQDARDRMILASTVPKTSKFDKIRTDILVILIVLAIWYAFAGSKCHEGVLTYFGIWDKVCAETSQTLQ
jgi:hypothetical protein